MPAHSDPKASSPVFWRRRATGVLVACILIGTNCAFSLVVLQELRQAGGWIDHTQRVMAALNDIRASFRDVVVAQQDFLATGDTAFVDSYREAAAQIDNILAAAGPLMAVTPEQQRSLQVAGAALHEEMARLADGIARRAAQGVPPVARPELRATQAEVDHVRALLRDMQVAERHLFEEWMATADHRAIIAQGLLAIGTLGSLVMIVLTFRLMSTEAATLDRHVRDRTLELGNAVSALRQRGIQLRAREEQLRVLIEAAPAAIAMFDRDMRYLAVSQRFRDDYRIGDQPLIGRSHYDLFPEIPEERRDLFRRCLAGATARSEEETFEHPDGTIDWVRWEIHPWHDGEDAIGGIGLFSEVITARKRAEAALAESEAQLRQAQKMEAVGQLTGGIAHDFNNMLGVMIGNVELLQDRVGQDAEQSALAQEILDTAMNGAQLIHRLLAFARKQPLQPETIDLRTYMPNLIAILRRTLGTSIHLTTEVADELWLVQADQAQVGEALLNLAINARDAMPHGGDLTVRVANVHLDDHYAAQNMEVAAGDYVMLSVTDTGHGMPPEVIERAIEPFFTTKDIGLGSGLGLSMIYGFAKQSGGHLKIYSEVGFGTTVRLYLPRVPTDGEDAHHERAPLRKLTGGTEAVLLVDDNAPMRDMARRHLTALGYAVTTAESGPEALAILESGGHFDLLFTDVVMPDGMTGYDLAKVARRLRPQLKVLLTTGYGGTQSRDGNGNWDEMKNSHSVIGKPYRRQELAERVRAILDGPP